MYDVYAILRIYDSSCQSTPDVSVEATSNYEEELIDELYNLYNEYLKMISDSYSEKDKEEDWYQDMLKQIQWDTDRRGFSDTSGYKQSTRYVLVKLQ